MDGTEGVKPCLESAVLPGIGVETFICLPALNAGEGAKNESVTATGEISSYPSLSQSKHDWEEQEAKCWAQESLCSLRSLTAEQTIHFCLQGLVKELMSYEFCPRWSSPSSPSCTAPVLRGGARSATPPPLQVGAARGRLLCAWGGALGPARSLP